MGGKVSVDRGISPEIVGPVLRALEELGFDSASGPGVAVGVEPGAEPFVPGGTADRLLDGAARALGDEALGIHIAQRIPIGGLGMLDYALCTSASLREALARVSRYYGVVTQRVKLGLVVEEDVATLVFERHPDVSHSRHWIEFSFGIIAERTRQTLGRDVVFSEVALVHAAPADASFHDGYFGTKVAFGQPTDRLSFAASLLDGPLLTAAASLAALLDQRLRELEPGDADVDPFVGRVRHALVEQLDKRETGIEDLAKRLHLTRRTLQRELASRETSHRQLLDEVRRERAQALLAEGKLTVTEVAGVLGFSEPSAFFRAFRRWTGTSPRGAAAGDA